MEASRFLPALAGVMVLALATLPGAQPTGAQPTGPPRGPGGPTKTNPGPVAQLLEEVRRRLERATPATAQQRELAGFVRQYLDAAKQELAAGREAGARSYVDAADGCRRPLDHLDRIRDGAEGPPGPRRERDPEEHLRRVYFRLRLSEAFLEQLPAPAPRRLLELAREFYEKGGQAQQEGRWFVAGEYARASDDLTHVLESLAQANGGARAEHP